MPRNRKRPGRLACGIFGGKSCRMTLEKAPTTNNVQPHEELAMSDLSRAVLRTIYPKKLEGGVRIYLTVGVISVNEAGRGKERFRSDIWHRLAVNANENRIQKSVRICPLAGVSSMFPTFRPRSVEDLTRGRIVGCRRG